MKSLYDSALHHPGMAYLAGAALLVLLARRLPFLYAYLTVFLVVILADATVTGAFSPVPLDTPLYTALSVIFIILGDFRYFFLAERATRPAAPLSRVLAFSVPLSLVLPAVTGVLTRTVPLFSDTRVLYASYELVMGVLVLSLDRLRFSARDVDPAVRRWIHEVSLLFATLYFGWGACDLVLLAGVELGHALRIIPNVLYYAALLPFILWRAPKTLKQPAQAQEAS